MDVTEIDHGYLVRLQAEFPDIFREARENNWIVCIPKREALLGVTVDEQFVRSHMLRPSPALKGVFVSADASNFSCAIDDEWSWLEVYPDCDCDGNDEPSPPDKIKIIGKDCLLFPDLNPLTLVVLNACICVKSLNSTPTPEPERCIVDFDPHLFDDLPQDVHSIREANRFFGDALGTVVYDMIEDSVERFTRTYTISPDTVEDLAEALKRDVIDANVQEILRLIYCIRADLRNPGFVRCVNMAVECLVMSKMHDEVFPAICKRFRLEDQLLTERATEFCKLRITADQLGAKIEFTVPLPAAVVELASLDSFKTPLEKIQAMRNSVDLVIAEVKTALVQALSTDCDFTTPKITPDDLLPLMTVVLMKAKPLHLASNAYYTTQYCWAHHDFGYALATVRAAKDFLQTVRPAKLRRSQTKLVQELSLEQLMLVTGEKDARKSSDGKEIPDVVYENQMERVTAQIEASTRQLSQEQIRSPQMSRSCTPSGNSTPGSPFLSPFPSRSPRVRFRIGESDTGA